MTIEQRIHENSLNTAISTVEAGQFQKSQPRGFDMDAQLSKGDTLIFPSEMPKIYRQDFGERVNRNTGKTEKQFAEFIVINVRDKDGNMRAINFFPSSLTRSIWKAKKEGDNVVPDNAGGPLSPKGTAVELFRKFKGQGDDKKTDVQLGMEALLGKEVYINNAEQVNTQRWGQVNGVNTRLNELRPAWLYTYDLEKAA
jgi:hypothetical protein